jgi:hypothetical protein
MIIMWFNNSRVLIPHYTTYYLFTMLAKRIFTNFCLCKMNAEKYIRSISQQALLFKPIELRQLTV